VLLIGRGGGRFAIGPAAKESVAQAILDRITPA
jgi:hypothetical protein